MSKSLTKLDFYADVVDKCINNNIELNLVTGIAMDDCVGGWFTGDDLTAAFTDGEEASIEIFVHESCHLDQFLEKSPLWFSPFFEESKSIWDTEYRDKHPRKYLNVFKQTCKLEIDADKRVIEKNKKYNLGFDIESINGCANIYHASYYYFHKYKCFYHPDTLPQEYEKMHNLFDNTRIMEFDEVWKPNKLLGEFIKKHHELL